MFDNTRPYLVFDDVLVFKKDRKPDHLNIAVIESLWAGFEFAARRANPRPERGPGAVKCLSSGKTYFDKVAGVLEWAEGCDTISIGPSESSVDFYRRLSRRSEFAAPFVIVRRGLGEFWPFPQSLVIELDIH